VPCAFGFIFIFILICILINNNCKHIELIRTFDPLASWAKYQLHHMVQWPKFPKLEMGHWLTIHQSKNFAKPFLHYAYEIILHQRFDIAGQNLFVFHKHFTTRQIYHLGWQVVERYVVETLFDQVLQLFGAYLFQINCTQMLANHEAGIVGDAIYLNYGVSQMIQPAIETSNMFLNVSNAKSSFIEMLLRLEIRGMFWIFSPN
jgi:hypothetical protein